MSGTRMAIEFRAWVRLVGDEIPERRSRDDLEQAVQDVLGHAGVFDVRLIKAEEDDE